MALIDWDDNYSVNVAEIDDQHKKLVNMLNKLYGSTINGNSHEILSDILHGLSEYTVYHFSTEEKYFEQFNYKFTKEHKAQHQNFVKKVLDFQDKFDNNESEITVELIKFLVDWVTEHIMDSDHKFKKCFNDNGLY